MQRRDTLTKHCGKQGMSTHLRIVRRQRLVGGDKQQLVPDVLRVAAGGAPPLDGQVAVQLCMEQIRNQLGSS